MNYLHFFCIFLIVFTLFGCTQGVSQQQAEDIAISWISDRVKFSTSVNGTAQMVNRYQFDVTNSAYTNGQYHFVVMVSSTVSQEVKTQNLSISVDKPTGQVVVFNGQHVR